MGYPEDREERYRLEGENSALQQQIARVTQERDDNWIGLQMCAHARDLNQTRARQAEQSRDALRSALEAVLAGKDCPMCDSGRLRDPNKSHWPECAFNRARAVLVALDAKGTT